MNIQKRYFSRDTVNYEWWEKSENEYTSNLEYKNFDFKVFCTLINKVIYINIEIYNFLLIGFKRRENMKELLNYPSLKGGDS